MTHLVISEDDRERERQGSWRVSSVLISEDDRARKDDRCRFSKIVWQDERSRHQLFTRMVRWHRWRHTTLDIDFQKKQNVTTWTSKKWYDRMRKLASIPQEWCDRMTKLASGYSQALVWRHSTDFSQGWHLSQKQDVIIVLHKSDETRSMLVLKELVWQAWRSRRQLFTRNGVTTHDFAVQKKADVTQHSFSARTMRHRSRVLTKSILVLTDLVWQAWRSRRQFHKKWCDRETSKDARWSFSTRMVGRHRSWFSQIWCDKHDEVVVSYFTNRWDRSSKDDRWSFSTRTMRDETSMSALKDWVTSMTKSSSAISQNRWDRSSKDDKNDEGWDIDVSSQRFWYDKR